MEIVPDRAHTSHETAPLKPMGQLQLTLPPWGRGLLLGLYFILLSLLYCGLLQIDSTIEEAGVSTFEGAVIGRHGQGEIAGGGSVTFPYRCLPDADDWNCARVFHVVYRKDAARDHTLTSLYIPHFIGSLRVRLNDTLITASHWSRSSFLLGSEVPLLVPLPAALLRAGENEIEIRLEAQLAFGGLLSTFHVGPDHLLRPYYERARLLTVVLPRVIDGWVLSMAFIVLLIWAIRPWDRLYLIFGIMLVSILAPSIPSIFTEFADETLLRFANLGRYVAGVLILPFVWLLVGRRPPIRTRYFLTLPLIAFGLALLPSSSGLAFLATAILSPLVLLLAILAVLELARSAVRKRSDAAVMMLGALTLLILLAARDFLIVTGALDESSILLGRYGTAVIVAVMSALLLWRFTMALRLQEQFSDRLRRSVQAAEAKLRASFSREKAQTRRAAMEAERVRIMRDLHDGIAGHLVSILALSELRQEQSLEDITHASRRALDDLRIVVASLQDVGDDLALMLTNFRERIAPQLRAAKIGMVCRSQSLPDLPGLNATATLTIFRILQEAVVNAVRHAASKTIEIEAGRSPLNRFGARLVVRDFGSGGAADRPGGVGMGSMRRRAESIGARLTIDSGPGGTAIILDLPERMEHGGD